LTVAVAALDSTLAVLRAHGRSPGFEQDRRGRYIRIEPSDANGTWLEFLELAGDGESSPGVAGQSVAHSKRAPATPVRAGVHDDR
jgi:hypothetical protein